MSKTDILIVSYAPDAEWLSYCLRSIQKYATGFSGISIVYPDRDDSVMRPICYNHGARACPVNEPGPPLGHLSQNIVKTSADIYCPDATHVLHLDSDCMLVGSMKPDDYFRDGKPVLVRRVWENAADAVCWREPTKKALGWDPPWETMARMPLIFDIRTYRATRQHIEEVHKILFSTYVYEQKPTFPYGFCEFNSLGGYAVEKTPELYHIITVPDETLPGMPIRQLWSHSGIVPEMREWLEETLRDGEKRPHPEATPMPDYRRKLLGL